MLSYDVTRPHWVNERKRISFDKIARHNNSDALWANNTNDIIKTWLEFTIEALSYWYSFDIFLNLSWSNVGNFSAQWMWNHVPDFTISGYNVMSISDVSDAALCQKECLLLSSECKSVIYRPLSGNCELKSTKRLQIAGTDSWIYSMGDNYYDFYHTPGDTGKSSVVTYTCGGKISVWMLLIIVTVLERTITICYVANSCNL